MGGSKYNMVCLTIVVKYGQEEGITFPESSTWTGLQMEQLMRVTDYRLNQVSVNYSYGNRQSVNTHASLSEKEEVEL